MNESKRKLIDYQLKEAGWYVNDMNQIVQGLDIIVDSNLVKEQRIEYSGHQVSDYTLIGQRWKYLAVLKAKRY